MQQNGLLFLLLAASACADDRIVNLPGGSPPPPAQAMFSGYINVNASHGRNLFYWLVESASADPEGDPLVLWTNGGAPAQQPSPARA